MTSGDWRVDSIERRGTNKFQCLIERQAALNIVAQALQIAQGCMALVAVIDVFLDAQFLQQQHTTDAEQDFLLQTVLPVATIECVGNGLVEL